MNFDREQLTEFLVPIGLNWKAHRVAGLALIEPLVPLLKKRVTGRESPASTPTSYDATTTFIRA